jgi:ATP-dependent DNA helicase RecG
MCLSGGHLPPTFENFQHGFKVTVYSKHSNVVENVVDSVVENVVENESSKEAKIVDLIVHNGKISAVEIARRLGISERTAQRYIKALQAKHAIKRIGSDKGGHWEVAVHS